MDDNERTITELFCDYILHQDDQIFKIIQISKLSILPRDEFSTIILSHFKELAQ